MPTERDRNDDDEGARARARDDADEAEREDEESDAEAESESAATTAAPGEGEEQVDAPRNRAERRAAARAEKRGTRPQRGVRAAPESEGRVKLPPRTISGKSSADEVPPWARGVVDWMSRNRRVLIGGAAAVVLVVGGSVAWTLASERKQAQAAGLYRDALQIASAEIRGADAPPDPPNAPPRRGPTYPDHEARARAARAAFHRVWESHPDAPVAPLAKLSEAWTLYDLGRHAEARALFQSLAGANVAGQEGRVLEGLGFTLEATNDLPGALRQFEELGRVAGGAFRDTAQYHQARVLHRQGRADRARDLLRGLIERLNRARPEDPATGNASVIEQAQALLREIDPNDALARRAAPAGNDRESILRMLQERFGRNLRVNPQPPERQENPRPANSGDGGP